MSTHCDVSVDESQSSAQWRLHHLSMPDCIIAGTALFITLNALSVCIGWWIRAPIWVQLFADDAPTHFNTAVGFIFLGCGEIALVLHRRGLVIWAAGAVILLVSTELAEVLLGIDTGIDTLFAKPPKLAILRSALAELTSVTPT
jgi:hypothetical protein